MEALPEAAPRHPVLHLAPEKGWMNDPNGLSYVDGLWHAYYQHFPDDDVWGPMHWRHATSPDLLDWTDHGIALHPTPLGTIFSGSVVVDETGAAGFGEGTRVAIFTLADNQIQRQGIAWSPDGYRWEMFDGNPVLTDEQQPDFRDPKVIRFDDQWIMVLAVGDRVRLYRSTDLRSWVSLSEVELPGLVGTVECPDLIEVLDAEGASRWVLVFGDDRAGPGRNGATIGVVGSFDGERFVSSGEPQRLDIGPDWYAAQSFFGLEATQNPVLMGWMNSWRYANTHPSAGRRGVLSLPRRLEVDSAAERSLGLRPAVNLDEVFNTTVEGSSFVVDDRAARVRGDEFSLRIVSEVGEGAKVQIADGMATMTRRCAAMPELDVETTFAVGPGQTEVIVDHGTLEVFSADGNVASCLVFAGPRSEIETTGSTMLSTSPGSR